MSCGFLEIEMKTSLASELAGGIACPTFTKPGVVFVGQAFSLPSLRVLRKLLKLEKLYDIGHSGLSQLTTKLRDSG